MLSNKTNKLNMSTFKKNLPLTVLALPAVLFLFVFSYIPLYGLVLPFKNYDYSLGFFKSPWVGLENFKFLFNNDAVLIATRNTILYNVAFIILGLVFSVGIALMLYEMRAKFVKTYQTILFLPYFISWVVAAYAA
ncbi:MAG: sugar ABC transporter permease, partial [Clostridia bacterium]|nr:sugar ABC transporter permease [Clostridia bacterium]